VSNRPLLPIYSLYLPPIRRDTTRGAPPQPGSCPTAGGRKGPVIVYDVMTAPLCE